jgi:predicted NAD/FAD-binding protein
MKGATVAGGALAGVAMLGGAVESEAASRSAMRKWNREADVVIVGSGAAGLSAAVEAAGSKAKVIVLEKLPGIGGVSRMSFGNYGTLNSPEQRRARGEGLIGIQRLHGLYVKKNCCWQIPERSGVVRIFVE